MTLEEIIAESRAAADADATWLGSDEQLDLLAEFARARGCAGRLRWSDEAGRSYAQAGTIALQRVSAEESPDRGTTAAEQALTVWHETMHVRHTDNRNATGFELWLAQLRGAGSKGAWVADLAKIIFNALEDVRIARLERAAHPEHGARLDAFFALTVDRQEEVYLAQVGEPWTDSPVSPAAQSRLALLEQIYVGDRSSTLYPVVREIVVAATPMIETARGGADTDAARDAAIDIARLVAGRWHEIV